MLHGHFLLCYRLFDDHALLVKLTESPEPRTKAISDRKPGTPPGATDGSAFARLLPEDCNDPTTLAAFQQTRQHDNE